MSLLKYPDPWQFLRENMKAFDEEMQPLYPEKKAYKVNKNYPLIQMKIFNLIIWANTQKNKKQTSCNKTETKYETKGT